MFGRLGGRREDAAKATARTCMEQGIRQKTVAGKAYVEKTERGPGPVKEGGADERGPGLIKHFGEACYRSKNNLAVDL